MEVVLIFKKGRQKGIVLKGKRPFIFQRGYKVFCIGRFYRGGGGFGIFLYGRGGENGFFCTQCFFILSFLCPFKTRLQGRIWGKIPPVLPKFPSLFYYFHIPLIIKCLTLTSTYLFRL